jgi:pimeloyl-ACP methyl ester carboxylesterase
MFLNHKAPGEGERVLLVMLPGAGIEAEAFAENGMVAAAQAHGEAVDVIAARPELELYLDGGVAAALHEVVEPALAEGERFWLLGISLGGMGALLYAAAHEDRVAGIFLLAPFLGTKGTVAEVAKAGGLAAWREKESAATEAEKRMLVWLRDLPKRPESPPVYLGYGRADRFAPGHFLLAAHLPADRVVTADGGHDWQTWAALWQGLLATRPFGGG